MGDTPSAPSNTTTTSSATATPWAGASQFLTNAASTYNPATGQYANTGAGPTGAYEQASNYNQQYSQLTPQQTALIGGQQQTLTNQNALNTANFGSQNQQAQAITGGAYDTSYGAVAPSIAGQSAAGQATAGQALAGQSAAGQALAGQATAGQALAGQSAAGQALAGQATAGQALAGQNANAATSNLINARAGQGALDPTRATSSLLTGQPDNPYLAKMNQANIDQSLRGYGDAVQQLNQQTMPGINNDAFAAGQYGGSRQGIAQGMALQGMQRNARDLGIAAMDSGNQLVGTAYENAQNRMATTANDLNNQAGQNSQFNAGQTTQNNQYNATNQQSADQFNSGQTTQNSQYNTNLAAQNSQFNAGQATQNSQFNAGNQQAANLFNVGQTNANSQFNAGQTTQNSQFNAGQATQNSQYNTGLAAELGQFNAGQTTQNSQFNAGQNTQNSQFNAGQDTQNSQFNANLGVQNNQQQLAQQQQNLNNRLSGVTLQDNAMNNLFNGQNAMYSQQQQLAQMPQIQQQNAINSYLDAISPGAGMGTNSASTNTAPPYYTNQTAQALGLMTSGAGLVSNLSGK
jgi:hypothetical protein